MFIFVKATLASGRYAYNCEVLCVLERHPVGLFFKDSAGGKTTINSVWYVQMVMTFLHCPELLLEVRLHLDGNPHSESVTSLHSRPSSILCICPSVQHIPILRLPPMHAQVTQIVFFLISHLPLARSVSEHKRLR